MREGALRWRIEHPPFWAVAFARLRELHGDVGLQESVRLLTIFAHLRLVDLEIVEHCESLLTQADGEALLDLREAELIGLISALGKMQKPAAMAPALRVLASRVHRLDAGALTRLLKAVQVARHDGAADFTDAAARSLVERGDVPAEELSAFAEAAAALAAIGQCRAGPRTGLELLFKHSTRRAREQPSDFGRHLEQLVRSAQAAGYLTPALSRLLQERSTEGHQ